MQLSALTSALGRFVSELQRRKVIRVAAGYAVVGWIILQVAVALEASLNLPVWFDTVVVSFLLIGFPVALVLAWLFEFTPEGIKRTTPAGGEGALVKPQTTDVILAGMLGLVLVVALAQAFAPRATAPVVSTTAAQTHKPQVETPALGDKSIAVLPFANLSPDKENEYFADGLTEEVLNLLAKIGDLKVISRTSSFAFKGKNIPLPEIAKRLGVRHILEGSVRSEGDELRVTAQLIDVVTDTHLWSETYDRKMDNVFALQEEIARDIAGALKAEVTFASEQNAPTKNLEAYRLLLQARALHLRRNEGDLSESVDLFKRAIALDPKFAEAHAGLASNYAVMAAGDGAPAKELIASARRSANTALELKPNLARAYGVLGTLARHELDWKASIENFSKAVALDPSDSVTLTSLGTTYSMIGKFEQGKTLRDEAGRIDPIYNFLMAPVQLFDTIARRDDRAATEIATKLTRAQGELRGLGFGALAVLAREKGDIAGADANLRSSMRAYGRTGPMIEAVARAVKSRAAIGQAAKALRDEAAKDPKFDPAGLYFVMGDHAGFFDSLDERLARRGAAGFWVWMSLAWRLSSADGDASQRFKALARKIGLVDYWKESGWPDKCRAKGADDFECS